MARPRWVFAGSTGALERVGPTGPSYNDPARGPASCLTPAEPKPSIVEDRVHGVDDHRVHVSASVSRVLAFLTIPKPPGPGYHFIAHMMIGCLHSSQMPNFSCRIRVKASSIARKSLLSVCRNRISVAMSVSLAAIRLATPRGRAPRVGADDYFELSNGTGGRIAR
jgi:hypothetical protein